MLLVIGLLTGVDPSSLLDQGPRTAEEPPGGGLEECRTGADVGQNRDCRFVALENSVQGFWSDALGPDYRSATLVGTACGQASSQAGPFYCPADQGVYLDLGFFDVMESQLGAQGGDFAEACVIAHEYAHHVQNLAATSTAGGREPIIAVGIDGAERIGDDYIQERFSGSVAPETWTHGSSEQRRRWFTTGPETGDPNACDTFAAPSL